MIFSPQTKAAQRQIDADGSGCYPYIVRRPLRRDHWPGCFYSAGRSFVLQQNHNMLRQPQVFRGTPNYNMRPPVRIAWCSSFPTKRGEREHTLTLINTRSWGTLGNTREHSGTLGNTRH